MSFEIKGIEIFSTGKHNGDKYSSDDIDLIIENTNNLDFLPAVKLGHKHESGAPAFGYLKNLSRKNNTIVADLVNLPKEIFEAIKAKRYARVSVEIYENLNRSGKIFKKAIGAIALLGQEIPGVAGLKTITEFSSEDYKSKDKCEFDIIDQSTVFNENGKQSAGSGKQTETSKMSDEKLKEYEDKISNLQTQLDKLVTSAADNENTAKDYEAKFSSSQKELDELKNKLLSRDADDKAKQVQIPALQGAFKALYEQALNSETTMKVYSVEDKKDQELSMVEVLDNMAAFINEKAGAIFKEYAQSNTER